MTKARSSTGPSPRNGGSSAKSKPAAPVLLIPPSPGEDTGTCSEAKGLVQSPGSAKRKRVPGAQGQAISAACCPVAEIKPEPAASPPRGPDPTSTTLSTAPSLQALTPKRIKRPSTGGTGQVSADAAGGGTSSATDTPVTAAASPTAAACATCPAAAAAAQTLFASDLFASLGACHMGESGSPSDGSGNATLTALLGMQHALLSRPQAAASGADGGGAPAYSAGPTPPASYAGTTSDDNLEGDDDRAKLRREKNRVAARKCRQKKVQQVARMQQELQQLIAQNNDIKEQVGTWHRMFTREVRLKEAMKTLLQVAWGSASLAHTTGHSVADVLLGLEAGTLDVASIVHRAASNGPATSTAAAALQWPLAGGSGGVAGAIGAIVNGSQLPPLPALVQGNGKDVSAGVIIAPPPPPLGGDLPCLSDAVMLDASLTASGAGTDSGGAVNGGDGNSGPAAETGEGVGACSSDDVVMIKTPSQTPSQRVRSFWDAPVPARGEQVSLRESVIATDTNRLATDTNRLATDTNRLATDTNRLATAFVRLPVEVEAEACAAVPMTPATSPKGSLKRLSTAGGSHMSAVATATAGQGSGLQLQPRLTSFSSNISQNSPFAQVAANAPAAHRDARSCAAPALPIDPPEDIGGSADAQSQDDEGVTGAEEGGAVHGGGDSSGGPMQGGSRVGTAAVGLHTRGPAASSLELSLRNGSSLLGLPGGLTGGPPPDGPTASTSLELLLNSLDGVNNCNSIPLLATKDDLMAGTSVMDALEELTGTHRQDSGFAFQLRDLDEGVADGRAVGGFQAIGNGCCGAADGVDEKWLLAQRLGLFQDPINRFSANGQTPASMLLAQAPSLVSPNYSTYKPESEAMTTESTTGGAPALPVQPLTLPTYARGAVPGARRALETTCPTAPLASPGLFLQQGRGGAQRTYAALGNAGTRCYAWAMNRHCNGDGNGHTGVTDSGFVGRGWGQRERSGMELAPAGIDGDITPLPPPPPPPSLTHASAHASQQPFALALARSLRRSLSSGDLLLAVGGTKPTTANTSNALGDNGAVVSGGLAAGASRLGSFDWLADLLTHTAGPSPAATATATIGVTSRRTDGVTDTTAGVTATERKGTASTSDAHATPSDGPALVQP